MDKINAFRTAIKNKDGEVLKHFDPEVFLSLLIRNKDNMPQFFHGDSIIFVQACSTRLQ